MPSNFKRTRLLNNTFSFSTSYSDLDLDTGLADRYAKYRSEFGNDGESVDVFEPGTAAEGGDSYPLDIDTWSNDD